MTPSAATPRLDPPNHRAPRRAVVVLALLAAVAVLSGCLSNTQQEVLDRLNASRRANGRGNLVVHYQAQSKAQAWAEKLARENKLYHSNLRSGITVKWCGLAENVGYGSSIAAVQTAYMNSAGHKANVLNSSWNGVGVGYAKNGSRVFTVQVFIRTC